MDNEQKHASENNRNPRNILLGRHFNNINSNVNENDEKTNIDNGNENEDNNITNIDNENESIENNTEDSVSNDNNEEKIGGNINNDLILYTKINNNQFNIGRSKYIAKYVYNNKIKLNNVIMVLFKLSDNNLSETTNIGSIFCVKNKSNYDIKYFSSVNGLISSDGEFRSMYVSYDNVFKNINQFSNIWNDIEEYIIGSMNTRSWVLSYNIYCDNKNNQKNNIKSSLHLEYISTKILILNWFLLYYKASINSLNLKQNYIAAKIFNKNIKNDTKKFKLLKKIYKQKIDQFYFHIIDNREFKNYEKSSINTGYKIVPLNLIAVNNTLNIQYKAWKEYLITKKLSNFVINKITPCVPIVSDWYLINDIDPDIFDSENMKKRIENSEIAKSIVNIIKDAQQNTYNSRRSKNIKKWINKKFKEVHSQLNATTNYMLQHIILSKSAILYPIELLGATFADILEITKKANKIKINKIHNILHNNTSENNEIDYKTYSSSNNERKNTKYILSYNSSVESDIKKIQNVSGNNYTNKTNMYFNPKFNNNTKNLQNLTNSFSNYQYFGKYLFEICYTLLCIHSKMGVIHSDLHLNNATIGSVYHDNSNQNGYILYILNKKHYKFKNTNNFAHIIDYSRSIIDPSRISYFMDSKLNNLDEELFIKTEILSLTNLYLKFFTNKQEQKERILIAIKENFNAAFKLLSCLDTYLFCIKLLHVLSKKDTSYNSIILIKKVINITSYYLTFEFTKFLDNPKQYQLEKWPEENVISECFSDFIDNSLVDNVIIDVYNYDLEMKYSVDNIKKIPKNIKKHINNK